MKKQEARKPLNEYVREPHFIQKAKTLWGDHTVDASHLRAMINGEVQVQFAKITENIKDRYCQKCNKPKFYVFTKDIPNTPLADKKLVVCTHCHTMKTVYLNERSHGNTPLRADQIARGIVTVKKFCCGAIYGVAHDTQEKVDNACKDFCARHPNKKGVK